MTLSLPCAGLLVGALLACSATQAASAASVAYDPDGTLVYVATDGPDTPSVDPGGDGEPVRFDGSSPIVAAPAACSVAFGAATCPVDPVRGVRVVLGAGDDAPVVLDGSRALPVVLDGGPGNDRLSGRSLTGPGETLLGGPGDDQLDGLDGDDVLEGGDGDDRLAGDAGRDRLVAGAGDDRLVGDGRAPYAADVLDGGPGQDSVEDWSLGVSAAPISVTLDSGADDGFAGEGDELTGVETITTPSPGQLVGGEGTDHLFALNGAVTEEGRGGDDELRGADAPDVLAGGAGADAVAGGGGDDRLDGGPGRDTLAAGSGNDLVETRDGEADSVVCGLGGDRVIADAQDVTAPDCEQVERPAASPGPAGPAPGVTPPAHRANPAARLTIERASLRTVVRRGLGVRMSGAASGRHAIAVTRAGRTIAKVVVKVPASGRVKVRVRFSRAVGAALSRQRSVVLVVRSGSARASATLRR